MTMRHAGEFPSLSSFCFLFFFWGYKGFTPYCRLHKGEFFPPYTGGVFPTSSLCFLGFCFLGLTP